ncbi:MAG: efflux RND transporter permease subunit [Phycisphaerales bacterium]
MDLIRASIQKPVAVAVGVILIILFGVLALTRIPIQLTPNVDSTVITVSTFWEGANPQEVERDIIEKQEEKLKGVTGLKRMVSESSYSMGSITLEFNVGVDKDAALREVSDKLREVPDYPDTVDEPVITDGDPRDKDYIAWIIFETTDDDFDMRALQDFAEDRVKPSLERVVGVSEVNVLGGWEREVQIRVDPVRLAQHGLTYGEVATALRRENVNVSAGAVQEGKLDVAVRTVGRYGSVDEVNETIIVQTPGGPVRVGDVAEVRLSHKEPFSFVRNKGRTVLALNVQREVGSNVIAVMEGVNEELGSLNGPGGLLEAKAREINLNGDLKLRKVYDQTIYIDQAINLVISNIYIGGALAVITLLLFLRSLRSVGIIALAIPISVVGTFVAMVGLGRNLNVISLAGLAFAIGMVVDNSIVVLENIFRRLELGERPMHAAYGATREVWGAILASTLTTVAVFVPILFLEEEAGQLFRDISLAICASVLLSLVVSITVIPCAARGWLRLTARNDKARKEHTRTDWLEHGRSPSALVGRLIYWLCGSVIARAALVAIFAAGAIFGSLLLMPPADYLPTGNRNLVFGFMIPPPGYNLDTMERIAKRVEEDLAPYWEVLELRDDPAAYEKAVANLPAIQIPDGRGGMMDIQPPPINNYFFVGLSSGQMFHGAVSEEDQRVADTLALMTHATRSEKMPGTFAFSFQAPLFRVGGSTGASIEIEFVGDNLGEVTQAAQGAMMALGGKYGYSGLRPDPGNFNVPGPEVQLQLNRRRATELGLTTQDLGAALQALGDGLFVGEYRAEGESIDIKVVDTNGVSESGAPLQRDIDQLAQAPIATPEGFVVPLGEVARLVRTTAPTQINRVEERRAVTIEFSPPRDLALEEAMEEIDAILSGMRQSGQIAPSVDTRLAGSADKLTAVRAAMLGDGTLTGLLGSRMFLALLIVYLLMCVLFESFLYPLVILLSVPLATLGGFIGLRVVHEWSTFNRYLPEQKMDVLAMLGFVILIGVVVNNAILLVHQALNFMRGEGETGLNQAEKLPPRRAIAESARTRLRPIMMSTMTSVGGMLPLVVMPGSGSELYRGLGSVVVGGLLVSTIFTLFLVPLLFSLVLDLRLVVGGWFGSSVDDVVGGVTEDVTPSPAPAPGSSSKPGAPSTTPKPTPAKKPTTTPTREPEPAPVVGASRKR